MAMADVLKLYLDSNEVPYELVAHQYTPTSLRAAQNAHIEPQRIAKAVLLEDDERRRDFMIAVLPASRRVALNRVSECVGRPVHLASEEDAVVLFKDCEAGAIPALGPAYGLRTVWDDDLARAPDVYFEAGDHEGMVHMKTDDFMRLLEDCPHGHFGDRA